MPEGWKNILQTRSQMFSITDQATNMSIVFRKRLPVESASTTNPTNSQLINHAPAVSITINQNNANKTAAAQTDRIVHDTIVLKKYSNDVNELPAMKLPWNDPAWPISITAATATVDVWGRIDNSEEWVCRWQWSRIG